MSQSPILSPNGLIHVLAYSPSEGERGVPITVRIHFSPDLADAMYVRLVVGNKALPTKVTELPKVSYGCWQLHAAAPPFDQLQPPNTKVLMSVQALNEESTILDSVTFGEFTYWANDIPDRRPTAASITKLPRLQIPDSPALRRRSTQNRPSSPSPTTSDRSIFPKSPPQRSTHLHRRMKSGSLVRTKQANATLAGQEDLHVSTPILELATPLSTMCTKWTDAERVAGRRLVRFAKVQDGRRLIVSCEPISQDDYREADTVISCIFREEVTACYVTSVDVIYLLERLTNGVFPVEEKNRIRRNLEGLRPTTVSKHKPGFGNFFQRIMDFPDPRPRNIEKDLKVFDWNLLGQALEKILSKYSIYTSDQESTDSSPVDTPDSPEPSAPQISYPPPDDPSVSRFLDQQLNSTCKIEDCLLNTVGLSQQTGLQEGAGCGDVVHSFPSSPVGSTPSSVSLMEHIPAAGVVEGGQPQNKDNATTSSWEAGQGSHDIPMAAIMEAYTSLDPIAGYDYGNNSLEYPFPYDNYAYGGLSEEELNLFSEHYI